MPLPQLPQALPKTQADWDRVFNVFQQWQQGLQAVKWQTPTLLNGWVYYGAPYEPPGYYMDVAGVVHLRGLVKSGTVGYATPIFILSKPYLPLYTPICPVISADALGEVRILAPGDSSGASGAVVAAVIGSNPWLSLSGISFSTQ
jgi:hypothetical protein